ncbi:MAG: hypothetical protein E4H01_03735 [Lysobacterales bacterium]|nr:MAG: hypothetical protein E4H01_03735 [Xanthomonadales bacterium]
MTKELAEKFCNMASSPTERLLDPKRITHLRKKAEEGLLVTFHWSIAEVEGKEVRMNGQHSSAMLTELNGDFPGNLFVHLDRYNVKNEKGLALLFRQFDDKKSSRGPADIAGAYQGLYKDVRDVPRPAAKIGIQSIAWLLKTIEGAPVPSGDDVWQLFDRSGDYPFLHWIGELFTSKTKEMTDVPIVAAMYSTYNANEIKAKAFWSLVARGGEEYDDNHAATRLDKWLLSLKEITDSQKRPKPAGKYQAAIFCFNAFVEDREVKTIRTDNKKGWITPITG